MSGVQQATRTTLGELRSDAKLFPHLHPHGSGSLKAQDNTVNMVEYLQNRIMSLQHGSRQSPVWLLWMLDRLFKNDLYSEHQRRLRKASPTACIDGSGSAMGGSQKRTASAVGIDVGTSVHSPEVKQDNYEILFGRVDPK